MSSRSTTLKESAILYGVLVRIGGYSRPRAYIQFLDGQKLSCGIKNRSLAIAMASHLYKSIGVRGVAVWNTRDKTLLSFYIQELMPDRETASPDAFKGLLEIVGKYYDDEAESKA